MAMTHDEILDMERDEEVTQRIKADAAKNEAGEYVSRRCFSTAIS